MEDENYNRSQQKTGDFLLNIKKSPIDDRDYIAESIYSEQVDIPKKKDLREFLQPITNQGSQGTCSAQVAACMKEFQEFREKGLVGKENKMSPQFVYNLREEPGMAGMSPRETMKILNNSGVCREFLWPYGDLQYPDENSFLDAANFKIKNYAQVTTVEGLKTALVKDGVCYICFPVYNSSPRMWKANQGEKSQGGHAMSVVGYNSEGFLIRNSWGDDWGDNGYTIYPYTDWGAHWEVWTSIDTASVLPDFNSEDYARPITTRGLLWLASIGLIIYGFFSKPK